MHFERLILYILYMILYKKKKKKKGKKELFLPYLKLATAMIS